MRKEKSLDDFLPAKKSDGKEIFVRVDKAPADEKPKLSASSLYASSALSSNMFSGPNGEVYKQKDEEWHQYNDGSWSTAERRKQGYEEQIQRNQPGQQYPGRWIPQRKNSLSRGELDRQNLARIEGMDNYAKYRMEQTSRANQ